MPYSFNIMEYLCIYMYGGILYTCTIHVHLLLIKQLTLRLIDFALFYSFMMTSATIMHPSLDLRLTVFLSSLSAPNTLYNDSINWQLRIIITRCMECSRRQRAGHNNITSAWMTHA